MGYCYSHSNLDYMEGEDNEFFRTTEHFRRI